MSALNPAIFSIHFDVHQAEKIKSSTVHWEEGFILFTLGQKAVEVWQTDNL